MLRGATAIWRCAAGSALATSSTGGASASALSPSAAKAASAIAGPMFAVVWINNIQYRVSAGDVIMVKRVRAEIGSSIALKKVSMVGGQKFTAIGRPLLDHARITCTVEEHNEARPLVHMVNTYQRRIDWKPHQQTYSVLRVMGVEYEPQVVAALDKYTGDLDLAGVEAGRVEADESPAHDVHWSVDPSLPAAESVKPSPVY
uniref:Large ribosomal subunit protein bL21m n=1 Tax=Neobodo designis TaxID=312471 RepID=A0A7S1Q7G7_NEODS|mmetsp:Transcript_33682/g.103971  ORF Transcript_33682/g.103971 Transcript_33682/m.103971 type:complete len:202 (+) Transcript_33682:49-654(+)